MANRKSNTKNKPETSTQKYLSIDTIQDSVVILKDGGLRAVLMTSSMNFDLKSSDEQDAIIYAYQNFINSLDFPLQIQISSRVLNINGYLNFYPNSNKLKEMNFYDSKSENILNLSKNWWMELIL